MDERSKRQKEAALSERYRNHSPVSWREGDPCRRRSYSEKEISFELTEALQAEIDACNRESGLDIRLIRDEERAFGSFLARCGKFRGVKNYLVLMGKDEADTAENSWLRMLTVNISAHSDMEMN